MEERELRERLLGMGIDGASHGVLALLPLVQVAWADGVVQEAERELILEAARTRWPLDDEATRVLRNWLTFPPTEAYMRQGQEVLRALAHGPRGDVEPHELADVLGLCDEIARAAGGIFGFRPVVAEERAVLQELAEVLHVDLGGAPASSLLDDLGDLLEEEEEVSPAAAADTVVSFWGGVRHPEAMARLVVGWQGWREDERTVGLVEPIVIGRSREGVTLQVDQDPNISRRHCRFEWGDKRVYVEDLDSTTGTWVNGERVVSRRLFGGERVVVGSLEIRFELDPWGSPR